MASTIVNDLRTFTGAFEAYAQERGTFPAEVAAGVVPPEVADRLNNTAWKRPTPIGGHYNWDSGQTHYGVTYRAVIQISETSTSPMIQDLELWEVIDKLMDDAERGANAVISIDLEKLEIRGPDGGMIKFDLDPFRRQVLLNGWDDIALTLRAGEKIDAYEKNQLPWL